MSSSGNSDFGRELLESAKRRIPVEEGWDDTIYTYQIQSPQRSAKKQERKEDLKPETNRAPES